MKVEYYKSIADNGGAIGTRISSGVVNELLPGVTTQQMIDGANIHRKIYIKNIGQVGDVMVGLSTLGLFNASIFASTGDTQIVDDITGTENKYGASLISKLIDSNANEETINGTGGLINIKKIVVAKNASFTFFRVGEKVRIGKYFGEIQSISDLVTDLEITLVNFVPYGYEIGKHAVSCIVSNLATNAHASYWVNILVLPGSIETEHLNSIMLSTASEREV